MRALETGVLEDDDPTVLEESSFCLGCRACEPVCPAGVHYGALLEEWRDHLWSGRRRPWKVRAADVGGGLAAPRARDGDRAPATPGRGARRRGR